MTPDDPWLASTWPFVRSHLPPSPCTVVDIGCGARGGFVPALLAEGYDARGVDPAAPDGPHYRQMTFEELGDDSRFDAIVASASLHHVDDVDHIMERIAHALTPGGIVIVAEWAWELFDEPTAQWCFARLAPAADIDRPSWLHRHRDGWVESGKSWDDYLADWVAAHGLHPAHAIVSALDARFTRRWQSDGPYFFADLQNTGAIEEQAAIDAGLIRATGVHYVGVRP